MKLPSNAVITEDKIKNYLLSQRKRNDKSKWLAKAGYNISDWKQLEVDLRTQILSLDATPTEETKYGRIFAIKGILNGPNGKSIKVHTIWMTEHETKATKFITMFPD